MKHRWLLVSHAHLGYYWIVCARHSVSGLKQRPLAAKLRETMYQSPASETRTSTRDTTCCLFDTPPNSRNCTENGQFSSPLKMDQLFCIP